MKHNLIGLKGCVRAHLLKGQDTDLLLQQLQFLEDSVR